MTRHEATADRDQEGRQVDPVGVNGWEEFLQETRQEPRHQCIWRGQSDAKYPLRTTLERFPLTRYCMNPEDPFLIERKVNKWSGRRGTQIEDYFEALGEIVAEVNALRGSSWRLDARGVGDADVKKEFPLAGTDRVMLERVAESILKQNTLVRPDVYELMVHARHHGFPSPLLDWTRSRYIALYFAMADMNSIVGEVDRVAVYQLGVGDWNECDDTFCGACQEVKPAIKAVGLRPTSTPRHVRQQTVHTLCYGLETEEELIDEDEWAIGDMVSTYRTHGVRNYCQQCLGGLARDVKNPFDHMTEDQLEEERRAREGRIRKYIISVTPEEQLRCLAELRYMNIGAYQLFGTEEALMRDCAVRHVVGKTWW